MQNGCFSRGLGIGIVDDVTNTSLSVGKEINTSPEGEHSAVFWGMGSDGTVGANKNSVKIIGNSTDMYCQAYFVYDSKKSGGLTQSHLRFGRNEIHSPYLVQASDFVKEEGKSPFQLDSKAPTGDFREFILSENRYASLKLSFPEKADALYDKAEADAKERYESYLRLSSR